MPDFENIDQYETVNPRSGKARIVPIAPHSMQALDYRPHQRKEHLKPLRESESEFKSVEIEPVSIKQMEKEFRQATRSEARRRPDRGFSGWLRRLRQFLLSLLKPAKKKPRKGAPPKSRNRNSGQKGRGSGPRDKGDGSQQGGQGQRRGRRRRAPRSGNNQRQDNRKGSPRGARSEKAEAPRKTPENRNRPEGGQRGNAPQKGDKPPSRKSRSGRGRRNRRSQGSNPGRQGPGESGSGKPSGKSE